MVTTSAFMRTMVRSGDMKQIKRIKPVISIKNKETIDPCNMIIRISALLPLIIHFFMGQYVWQKSLKKLKICPPF